jgi:regulatory protein
MKSRKPKRLTRADLGQVALDYLARFATTEKRLRDMLVRRIRRSAAAHGDDPAPLLAAVPEVMQSLVARKLLDDRSFAVMKAASLTRRGTSRRQIGVKLAQLGVDGAVRDAALSNLAEEFGDSELAAALAYAKRRRLGPYRARHIAGAQRLIQEKRDLAAMARAGFSLTLARRILNTKCESDAGDY